MTGGVRLATYFVVVMLAVFAALYLYGVFSRYRTCSQYAQSRYPTAQVRAACEHIWL
jgi:hypothetical protein